MNYGSSISVQELLAQPTERHSQGQSPWRADEINALKLNFLSHLQAKGLDDTCEIWQRLNNITHPKYMSSIDKLDFLNDFKNANISTLNKLNKSNGIDGELIDIWQSVVRLKNTRSKVKFLECLCEIKKDLNSLEHVHLGHTNIKLLNNGIIRYSLSGSHNPHWIDFNTKYWSTPPPVNIIYTNSNGYSRGLITQIKGGKIYKKSVASTFWPKFDNDINICTDMINEEMAFAKMNKPSVPNKITPQGTSYYYSYASDGTEVTIQVDKFGRTSIYPIIN